MHFYADVVEFEHVLLQILIVNVHVSFFLACPAYVTAYAECVVLCVCRQTEHAKERTQFGSKIESYGAIQEKIARMMMKQYVTEVGSVLVRVNVPCAFGPCDCGNC